MNQIFGNIINTVIAFIVIILVVIIADLIFSRKIESNREKRQYRVRSFYVGSLIFVFLLARIWVEGFTHLLAVLGLVSAALVVTNKETIMNFVGLLIINWRGLFSQGDLIQIQQYKGYVKSFGVLYFTLAETSEGRNGNLTGRMIRIPNGLIANNPLINFSQTSHLLEQSLKMVITQGCDPEYAKQYVTELVNSVITEFYKDKKEYSTEYLKKKNNFMAEKINLTPNVVIQPKFDKPTGLELTIHFYSFSQDIEKLSQAIWIKLLNSIKENDKIQLSYNN